MKKRESRQKSSKNFFRPGLLGRLFPVLFLAATILVVVSAFLFEKEYSRRFFPGVIIMGESVGGKSYDEVYAGFKEKNDSMAKNGLTIFLSGQNGKKEIKLPMYSSGFTADRVVDYFSLGDWEGELKEAYGYGRTGPAPQMIAEQLAAFIFGRRFNFSPVAKKEALKDFFSGELAGFAKKSEPARFVKKGDGLAVNPETAGEKADLEKIGNILASRLASFDTGPVNYTLEADMPDTTAANLEPYLGLAKNIFDSGRIVYRYKNSSWTVKGSSLALWLAVKKRNQIGVDGAKLEEYIVERISPLVDSPVRDSRFQIVENKLVEITASQAGNQVNMDRAVSDTDQKILEMEAAFKKADQGGEPISAEVAIGVIRAEPKITKETVSRYGIKELLGFARTNFEGGSRDRQHNIETGASKLNGMLIAPGEEFSTVKGLGDITEEAGFVKEFVISQNKTKKELGGGLCQIATTLFRMALSAGLPITERINHRYVISYYGPGLDATIYGPHPDLRFVNDTGRYVLIQARAEKNEVIFELYGTKDGRTAEVSKPILSDEIPAPATKYMESDEVGPGEEKCSETPHKGITADAIYTVRYQGGETKIQEFHSVYQPWGKVCLVGKKKI